MCWHRCRFAVTQSIIHQRITSARTGQFSWEITPKRNTAQAIVQENNGGPIFVRVLKFNVKHLAVYVKPAADICHFNKFLK
jgi:hypothetical protein